MYICAHRHNSIHHGCGWAQEFKARPRSYYEEAFEKGRLRVEGAQVTASTPLKDSQRIIHFLHRHEPPVLSLPLQVRWLYDAQLTA